MRLQYLVCLLIASFAYAQAAPPSAVALPTTEEEAAGKPAENPPDPMVKPDDVVITIDYFCPDGPRPDGACQTMVTRAQFEKLTDALQPDMPTPLRLKVAYAYAKNIRMAAAAEKRGLDKTPAFEEEMRYARMQLLSQDLSRALEQDANNISDADFEDYYKKNELSFEVATMARIYVPRDKRTAHSQEEKESTLAGAQPAAGTRADEKASAAGPAQRKADQYTLAKLAVDLRARALNGEDPDKLQIEAFAAAGSEGMNANTKMLNVRRETLPPTHAWVMKLKPGAVSEVVNDPDGGHFIYKMMDKKTLTLEQAKGEMREQISKQRYHDSVKGFLGDATYSDAYFNPRSAQTAGPPHRHQREKRTGQSDQSEQGQQ